MSESQSDYEFESDGVGASDDELDSEAQAMEVADSALQEPSRQTKYSDIIEQWCQDNPSVVLRVVREDVDAGCVVINLWGAVLEVYVPQDNDSVFFVTTDDEDENLNSLLGELSDMPQLRTLPDLLTHASKALEGRLSQAAQSLERPLEFEEEETPAIEFEFKRGTSGQTQLVRQQSAVVLNWKKLQQMQEQLIEKVMNITSLSWSTTVLLLLHSKWDDEQMLRTFAKDPSAMLVSAGAAKDDWQCSPAERDKQEKGLCCVCFVDEAVARLPCGHGLCADDWPAFLRCNLEKGTTSGESCLHLRCPGERCPLIVPPSFFSQYLETEEYLRYKRLLVLSFVNDNSKIVWCPRPGCECSIAFSARKGTVTCDCGFAFCFTCKQIAHAPAKCSDTKAWLMKEEKMKGLADCKGGNTDNKPCPNPGCGIVAHKESGCNYLCCPHCKEKWCWQCGDWGGGPSGRPEPHHVYECNNPVNQDWYNNVAKVDVMDNEGRYWFYFERYKNHLNSLSFAEKLRAAVRAMVEEIEEEVRFRVHDVQLVRDSMELLIECRQVLAWTYVWAFFQKEEAKRRLFEFVQRDLETKTEQLSGMIEDRPADEVLSDPNRLADYVSVLRGYLENVKQYSVADDIDGAKEAQPAAASSSVDKDSDVAARPPSIARKGHTKRQRKK